MSKVFKNIVLLGITIVLCFNTVTQLIEFGANDIKEIMGLSILDSQKIMLNNYLLLLIFVYINTENISRIECVIREKIQLVCLYNVFFLGVGFSFVEITAIFASALYKGIIVKEVGYYFWMLFRLSMINILFVSIFILLLLNYKRIVALVIMGSCDLILLISWLCIYTYYNMKDDLVMFNNIPFQLVTTAILAVFIYLKSINKEYY